MKNQLIVKILNNIADILELQEVEFKPQAYRRAAQSIESLSEDIEEVYKREELEEMLEGREPVAKKIKLRNEIGPIVKNLKNQGAKIVFTNGCFDILHLGHVRYLREAKRLGDILVVGVNSDNSVTALKGPGRPYVSEIERAEILASMECVDFVIIFTELRPDRLIKIIRPDVHVKGGDYKITELPERKVVEALGGKVVVIPPIKGRSTTGIIEKILGKRQ